MGVKKRSYRLKEPVSPVMPDLLWTESQHLDKEHPWEDAVKRFLEFKEIEGRAEGTIAFYRNVLGTIRNHWDAQGMPKAPRCITTEHIEKNLVLFSSKKKHTKRTINTRIITCKAFFGFLYDKGFAHHNPAACVKLLVLPKSEPKHIDPSLLPKVIAACALDTFTGVRDYAMIMLLLDCGLRLKELIRLRVGDVRFRQGELLTRDTKGNEDRRVPFGARCGKALSQWLQVRGEIPGTDAVFTTVENKPMSKYTIHKRMDKLALASGVPKELIHPHAFRHTFGRLYIENGGDPYSLQDLLGHKDQSTTKLYVRFFGRELKERHNRFSPVENLGRA